MDSAHLRLEILQEAHIPELCTEIGLDPEVFRWLNFAQPKSVDDLERVLHGYIRETAEGDRVAHAVVLKSSGRAVGTTSYLDLNAQQNSLEIGSTFYAKSYWRSFVNTECKLLMLGKAFEERGVERVTIKTNALNERSRAAILRLGATFEGVLRHHMKRADGSWRDSAYFSILRSEWPAIKTELEAKLNANGAQQ
jgi:RimJ/RimL family protein N-acetyltransferase